ncbi:hypothetical protein JCM21900_006981 [Sporobolomyces salmonicolor]
MSAAASQALVDAVGSATNPSEQLYLVAIHYLSQVIELLRTTVTTDEQLQHPSKLSSGSTIGKHLRHLHDHYRLLLDSLSSAAAAAAPSSAALRVNYDVRQRDGSAESSHAAALESFEALRARLERETDQGRAVDPARPVRLEAVTPVVVEVGTTWARELWFASFHAVHHFALVRVIAVGELGLDVPPDFGVAPSTLVHRAQECPPTKL